MHLHGADSLSCTAETGDIVKELYGSKKEGEEKEGGPQRGALCITVTSGTL